MSTDNEPYVGLRPFEEKDSARFFGRDREIESLLDRICTTSTVVVFAQSGIGKTSLLRAGVMKQLSSHSRFHVVYINDWTKRLSEQVHDALRPTAPPEDADTDTKTAAGHGLHRAASDDVRLLPMLRAFRTETGARPVLILDQFEEIERYQNDPSEVWDELAPVMNVRDQPARVVVSVREDYLGLLDPLMDQVPGLMENRYRVQALSLQGIREAIRKPLETVECPFGIEDRLVDRIVDDFEARRLDISADGRVEAGYLQLVCRRLWSLERFDPAQQMRLETYEREGGIEQIVESHIHRSLSQALSEHQQHLLYAMTRYLVTPTGAKLALAVADLAELVRTSDFTAAGRELLDPPGPGAGDEAPFQTEGGQRELLDVAEALCKPGVLILRRREHRSRFTYELCHDVLGRVLLRWRAGVVEQEALHAQSKEVIAQQAREATERTLIRWIGYTIATVVSIFVSITAVVAVGTLTPLSWGLGSYLTSTLASVVIGVTVLGSFSYAEQVGQVVIRSLPAAPRMILGKIARSIVGVLVGLAAILLGEFAASFIMFRVWDRPLTVAPTSLFLTGCVAGWVAALIAGRRPMFHAGVLALLVTTPCVLVALIPPYHWQDWASVVALGGGALAGGLIRALQIKRLAIKPSGG